MRKIAIYLDRDGTIVQNREDYIKSIDEVEFLPNSLEAIGKLAELDAYIFMVSNQSLVGRQIVTQSEADAINEHIIEQIEANGGRIDNCYFCFHAPSEKCICRKPSPFLFLESLRDGYRFERAVVIGDQYTDIIAAHNLELPSMLVKTGLGKKTIQSQPTLAEYAIEDLLEAVDEITQWLNASKELAVVETKTAQ